MTDQHHTKARILLKKYLEGHCTEEEKTWVEEWYLALHSKIDDLADKEMQEDLYELQHRLAEIPHQKTAFKTYIRAIAAALFVALTVGLLLWNQKSGEEKVSTNVFSASQDVMPGSNRATLSFDGEDEIELSGTQEGLINDGTTVVYNDGTLIRAIDKVQTAMLHTPVAGQYQVTLPDGTKAWLNALSSIRYPTVFTGTERQVEVTGEVYLEVARDTRKPFIVQTDQQRIEVLGTSFNINAYGDGGRTLTTLTEGAIRLRHGKFGSEVALRPGQQAVVTDQETIEVKEVDVEEASSWKEGLHIVNDEPLQQYARKIERWYDVAVDIQLHGNKRLSAIIPRDAKLSEVLQAIELKTGVKFIIEGRRLSAKE